MAGSLGIWALLKDFCIKMQPKIIDYVTKYLNFFSAFLLFIVFIFFRFLSHFEAKNTDFNISVLLRNEFNSANSYALAKSIIDIEKIGQFECAKLVELNENRRVFYDSSNLQNCSSIYYKHNFFKKISKIDSLSGVSYEFSYFQKTNYFKFLFEILIYFVLILISKFLPKYYTNLLQIEKTKFLILDLENKNKNRIYNLSQKLAHDIRSPISTLNIISSKIENSDLKSLQQAVVVQINSIADDLLNESKSLLVEQKNILQKEPVPYLTKMLKNLEKEYQFKALAITQKITFNINYTQIENNFASQKLTSVIYSCINNFVQNAIEASSEKSEINIFAGLTQNQKVEISVFDRGKGIPEHILKRLGSEILSSGKEKNENKSYPDQIKSGNGIALYNANKELQENGAQLLINSIENQGTQVRIIF